MLGFLVLLLWGPAVVLSACRDDIEFDSDNDYAIVVDAGSSGSRFNLYQWKDDQPDDKEAIPFLTYIPSFKPPSYEDDEKDALKIEPGISSGFSDDMKADYQAAMDVVTCFVPESKRETTPIWLFATAGMRMVALDDQTETYTKISDFFGTLDFDFKQSKTISGEEEAVFLWVSMNHLNELANERAWAPKKGLENPIGAVDMGGASMQLAFLGESKDDGDLMLLDNSYRVQVADFSYEVFAKSWMGYGKDQLVARTNKQVESQTDVYGDPPVHPCLAEAYDPSSQASWFQGWQYKGKYDEDKCNDLVKEVMELQPRDPYGCPFKTGCGLDGVWVADVDNAKGKFYAISSAWYTMSAVAKAAGLEEKDAYDLDTDWIQANAKTYCSALGDSVSLNKYETSQCVAAAFLSYLFTLGFNAETDMEWTFTNDLNGASVGWTAGALINEMSLLSWSKIPAVQPSTPTTPTEPQKESDDSASEGWRTIAIIALCLFGLGVLAAGIVYFYSTQEQAAATTAKNVAAGAAGAEAGAKSTEMV